MPAGSSLPSRRDVHINTPLTQIAIAWFQDNPGVAMSVFPQVPVTKSTDVYWEWDLHDLLRREAKRRAPGTPSAGAGFRVDAEATYKTHKYALHKDLAWDILDEADDGLDLEVGTSLYLMQNVVMELEAVWADSYFKGGVWTTDKVGTTDFVKWDAGSSTPIVDIRKFKRIVQRLTGFTVNTVTYGAEAWDTWIDHAEVIDRVKATGSKSPAVITRELTAGILEVPRVFVADMVEATSNEQNATPTTAHIVDPKGILLSFSPPSPSRVLPSAGYTFSRKGRTVPNGVGVSVNRFDIEANEATRFEAQGEWDTKIVAADLGLFMSEVIS